MIELGKKQALMVVKKTEFGVYLGNIGVGNIPEMPLAVERGPY